MKYMDGLKIRQATGKGWIEVPKGGCFDGSFPTSKTRRGRVIGGGRISPTIMAGETEIYVYEGYDDNDEREKRGGETPPTDAR